MHFPSETSLAIVRIAGIFELIYEIEDFSFFSFGNALLDLTKACLFHIVITVISTRI